MSVDHPPVLSIIITAYNDAPAIPALAEEISSAMRAAGIAWEAIWIDDGSSDGTTDRLRELSAPHRFLRFTHNCGQSAGYLAGAETARGAWLATLDGDGQNDPADLPRLFMEATHCGVEAVFGIRTRRQDVWLRRASARTATRIRNFITGVAAADAGCATRVMRRDLFLKFPFFHGHYYYFPVFITMLGGKFRETPTNHRPRLHGRSHYGIRNRLLVGLVDLLGVCWLVRRHRQWHIGETGPT